MKLREFRKKVIDAMPAGYVMDNPCGGITTIVAYSESNITYRRGNSKIVVSFGELKTLMVKVKKVGPFVFTFLGKVRVRPTPASPDPPSAVGKRRETCPLCFWLKFLGLPGTAGR